VDKFILDRILLDYLCIFIQYTLHVNVTMVLLSLSVLDYPFKAFLIAIFLIGTIIWIYVAIPRHDLTVVTFYFRLIIPLITFRVWICLDLLGSTRGSGDPQPWPHRIHNRSTLFGKQNFFKWTEQQYCCAFALLVTFRSIFLVFN
jgi:hypothetical protein